MKKRLACLAVVVVLSLIVYRLTLAPTVIAGDSGELITAAVHQGVPHPPGYPLFCVVGKLFTLLPFGNEAFRLNLMSAVAMTASAVIVFFIVLLLGQPLTAATAASLIFAFSGSIWSQASVAEVYALYVLSASLVLLVSLHWVQRRSPRSFLLLGYVFGLALVAHLGSLMLVPGLFMMAVAGRGSEDVRRPGRGGQVAALLLVVLAISAYLYPLFASLHDPPLDWGDPETPSRLLAFVSGRAHRSAAVGLLAGGALMRRLTHLLLALWNDLSLAVPLAAIGLWSLVKSRQWWLVRAFAIFILFDLVYALWLNVVPLEATPFLLITTLLLVVLAGIGIGTLFSYSRRGGSRIRPALVSVIVVFIPIYSLLANWARADRSQDYVAYDFGRGVLETLEDRAVLFVEGDNISFPLYYLAMVEGERADVTICEREGVVDGAFYASIPRDARGEDRDRVRAAVETGFIDTTDVPVYYVTDGVYRHLAERGYGLLPWGLVYRVIRPTEQVEISQLPRLPGLRNLGDEDAVHDFMSRDLLVTYHLRRGAQLLLRDDTTGAHLEFRRAGRLADGNAWAMNSVGTDLLDAGWVREAVPYFEGAIARSSLPRADYYYNLGLARLQQHDPGAAVGPLERALSLDPSSIDVRYNLGSAYGWLGDHARARELFVWVIARSPDDPSALFNLALANAALGRLDEAYATYTRAVALDPELERARVLFERARMRGVEQYAPPGGLSGQGSEMPPPEDRERVEP